MRIRTVAALPLLLAPIAPFTLALEVAAAETTAQAKQATPVQVSIQGDETLYFNPDTTYELPVVIDRPAVIDGLSLPAGTVIQGRLEPVSGGLRYIATDVQAGGLRNPIAATSDVLHDIKDPRETSAGSVATDAAIGAAGGAVIGVIFRDRIGIGEIVGGAAAGAILGNVTAQRVVILEPGKSITLQAD